MKILPTAAVLTLCLTFVVWHSGATVVSPETTPGPLRSLAPTSAASPTQRRKGSLQKVKAPPFAEVLGIERIRLSEPIQFRGFDGVRPVTDFILIAMRLESFFTFLPRGIGPDEIMLNDERVEYLWFPQTDMAVLAPVPAGPLDQTELWLARAGSLKADATLESIKELRMKASRIGSAELLSLGPPVRAGLASNQIRLFANRKELQNHALDLIKRRTKRMSAVQP